MAIIICDIDGTLLNAGIYPIRKTIDWVNAHSKNYHVVIVTGRPESERRDTIRALTKAGVRYAALLMNPGSTRDSAKWKRAAAKNLKTQQRVALAIDNDEAARRAYSALDIKAVSPNDLASNTL